MSDRSGQKLGNYLLQRRLGQGGFAEVYLGEHVHLKTLAAIKVLHQVQLASDEEQKFQREARTIAKLNHAHIIRVLDFGIQESTSTVLKNAVISARAFHLYGDRTGGTATASIPCHRSGVWDYVYSHLLAHSGVSLIWGSSA